MDFLTITNQDRLNVIADNVISREREIFGYEMNISNYEAMIAAMPEGDWTQDITSYHGKSIEEVPLELVDKVSEYQFRDRLLTLIKTEKAECGKSVKIYNALMSQLPPDQRDTLIAEAKIRFNEKANK